MKSTIDRMILCAIILLEVTIAFVVLHVRTGMGWMVGVYVTTMTIFYHIAMRLAVGQAVAVAFRDRAFDPDKLGFPMLRGEEKLYRRLKVKRWKTAAITAKPEQFDVKKLTLEELLHNVMQAELVHRIIMVLSFLPLLLIIPYGAAAVFIVTSVAACIADMQFVIIQRYNRPRILRLMKRTSAEQPVQ